MGELELTLITITAVVVSFMGLFLEKIITEALR
jgi:hypothetical protein